MDFNNIKVKNPGESYKYCFVPSCLNTTYSTPEKHFICVPRNDEVRKQWCIAANCPGKRLRTTSYCCEDHFDLKEDLENYFYVKMVPNARKILKKGVVPRFFNTTNTTITSKNFTELIVKIETLGDNVTIEVGPIRNEMPENDSVDNDSVVSVKHEPVDEDNKVYEINFDNIKLENELQTELINKSETLDDNNVVMEGGHIEAGNDVDSDSVVSVKHEPVDENNKLENELQTDLINKSETLNDNNVVMEGGHIEAGNNVDSDSVVSVKHEPVDEDNKLYEINFENIKLERELQTELINKSETLNDNNVVMEGEPIKNEEGSNDSDSDKHLYTEKIKVEKELHTELIIKSEICEENTILASQRIHQSFLCDICNKRFNNKSNLSQHKRIHSGEKPFLCDICNKRFNQQCHLVRHIRIHTGEKPFACDICNKAFTEKGNLVEHKRIHNGGKPFLCDICDKTFSNQHLLVVHKQIHSRRKVFSCAICNKIFTKRCNLVRHRQIHSGKKPFSCDICNKTFTEKERFYKSTEQCLSKGLIRAVNDYKCDFNYQLHVGLDFKPKIHLDSDETQEDKQERLRKLDAKVEKIYQRYMERKRKKSLEKCTSHEDNHDMTSSIANGNIDNGLSSYNDEDADIKRALAESLINSNPEYLPIDEVIIYLENGDTMLEIGAIASYWTESWTYGYYEDSISLLNLIKLSEGFTWLANLPFYKFWSQALPFLSDSLK
ncbi:zinc finger protein 354C-like [Chrysoperla carnea]|uniref:zinc finger protein 354C-like n=1 Tax=Chrysoperla carnea TaxID=189513 RepID=UPI001D08BB20|nr:zinc finger protein 354C-like [Chrysoperla carnea]